MSAPDGKPASKLSRRRFVALTGASLAALGAGGAALGASAPAKTKSKKPAADSTAVAPAPTLTAHQKEFERQKKGTLDTLKTLRAYALPPGGDLPVVFKPMRTPKKGH